MTDSCDDSRAGIDMKELKIRKDRTPAVLRKLAKDEADAHVAAVSWRSPMRYRG